MSYKLAAMTWNPRDSTRKVEMLQVFTEHERLRPDEYAALVGWNPPRDAWTYLRRHRRNGYLRRGRDQAGRLVYSIAPNGARYLLWWKSQYPDAKVGR